jgi:predicted amidohydrolase
MTHDLVIHGGTLLDPGSGTFERRDLAVAQGRVVAVEEHATLDAADLFDATDLLVVPGLVDLHVHVY